MTRINLKSVLRKNGADPLIGTLITKFKDRIWIEDDSGKLIYGQAAPVNEFVSYITYGNDIVGSVKGDVNAEVVAEIINHIIKKESDYKKLGSEVLNLYQEINLIFNFSEKLAQTIDAPAICSITLDEARHVIKSDRGMIILLDENSKQPQVIACSGDNIFTDDNINEDDVLRNILLSGQSETITDTASLIAEGNIHDGIKAIIYASLKVNQRVLGAVILAHAEEVLYTAADIKLLTTLALQSTAAIESALLYEKSIREAKEREEAMRLVYEVTGKFVPYEFISSLGHKVLTDVKLGDQVEKIVTVLFSDIREYTSLSEQMSPEENFKFVCSFNERMGPAIRRNNGFINQYLGDAIMAIFPGSAADALTAAVEMQKQVIEFNVVRKSNGKSPIRIGVGMHTGPLIMGITGDADRLDATTISDAVNTASRLESLTKQYRSDIISRIMRSGLLVLTFSKASLPLLASSM